MKFFKNQLTVLERGIPKKTGDTLGCIGMALELVLDLEFYYLVVVALE